MIRIFASLFLCFCLVGCSTSLTHGKIVEGNKPDLSKIALINWEHLAGKWYGAQRELDGSRFEWIVERKYTGEYKSVFRHYQKDGTYDEKIEFGEWGLSGPVYFIIMRAWLEGDKLVYADMSNPYYRDAYEILSITVSEFHYRAYSDGSEFKMVKVEDDFTFPNQ